MSADCQVQFQAIIKSLANDADGESKVVLIVPSMYVKEVMKLMERPRTLWSVALVSEP